MHTQQRNLALLNVLGGAAVVGSYVYCLVAYPELRGGLWGGVPDALQPLYTVNMFLAAAGYFPFTYLLLFGIEPSEAQPRGPFRPFQRLGFGALIAFYALVLIPSALWLPMTVSMLQAPSGPLWAGIVFVLALVGLGSLGILSVLIGLARERGGALAWAAVVGCLFFCLQTACLDALIWPAFFPA